MTDNLFDALKIRAESLSAADHDAINTLLKDAGELGTLHRRTIHNIIKEKNRLHPW